MPPKAADQSRLAQSTAQIRFFGTGTSSHFNTPQGLRLGDPVAKATLPSSAFRQNSFRTISDPAAGKGILAYMDASSVWRYVSDVALETEEGLEPSTSPLRKGRSIQLSYMGPSQFNCQREYEAACNRIEVGSRISIGLFD